MCSQRSTVAGTQAAFRGWPEKTWPTDMQNTKAGPEHFLLTVAHLRVPESHIYIFSMAILFSQKLVLFVRVSPT
jgi:hypothetical protein